MKEVYRNNLKNWEFDKEAPQNLPAERATIVREQGASEHANFEGKPTLSKTDSSGYFGIVVRLKFYRFFQLLLPCTLFSALPAQDELHIKKRIHNHLLIHDNISAVHEAKSALSLYPESKEIQQALIDALCENGNETEALEQWLKTSSSFAEMQTDRRMLEVLAWGVLHKGEASSHLNGQLNALLGAAFTRDAKAIPILIDHLRGSNALLRSVAIKLSCSFADTLLKNEIVRMLKEEKVWYVRLEVIQAVGALHLTDEMSTLKEIIGNPKTLAEEKAAAMIALVSMYDHIDRNELQAMARHERAGLRQLALEVIAHLNLTSDLDLLLPLLRDHSPDVRISALNTLSLMRVRQVGTQEVVEWIEPLLQDKVPEVGITAAYALLLLDQNLGEKSLKKWLDAESAEWRRLASAALAACGKYGVQLCVQQIRTSKDPFVRANCALGLIGQHMHIKEACDVLYATLQEHKSELWMWDNRLNPLFRSLAPSELRHIDQIPHYPTAIDQLVRLDLLSVLSIVRYPKAQEAVKGFLQKRVWGVTGAAAATLIQEGDEGALDAVRALLEDPDEHIRTQAALIMALVGNDPSAVRVLQKVYPYVDRELKMHILEAIAHVGDSDSIPFLLTILKEPFQTLRCVAASALIQCLNH